MVRLESGEETSSQNLSKSLKYAETWNHREEWKFRRDFTYNEAFRKRCSCDFMMRGHRVELKISSISKIKMREERCWATFICGKLGLSKERRGIKHGTEQKEMCV